MKLYIPVLESNIDNILTAESLSPYDFYDKRGFGYKSFNMLSDYPTACIVLYSDLKQCPHGKDIIYIHLDISNQQGKPIEVEKGIYTIHSTIELHPWDTTLLFTSSASLQKAVSFCNGSLKNKFWQYFEFKLIRHNSEEKLERIHNLETSEDNNAELIKQDLSNNRLKGFIFGYLIGRSITISPELAMLRKYGKQISDLCTVIPTINPNLQKEYVEEVNDLKTKYNDYNPKRKELQGAWRNEILTKFSSEEDCNYFKELASRFNVLRIMMDGFAKEKEIYTGPSIVQATQKGNWKEFKEQLDSYTNQLIKEYLIKKGKNQKILCPLTIDEKHRIHCEIEPYYEELINSLICGDNLLVSDNIVSNRQEVATQITLKVKEAFTAENKTWIDSKEYNFFNNLRKSINSSKGLDFSSGVPDDMAMTFAIYILRCDDFEDMIRYAVACGFGRYDLLLGLWGANVGYVDLNKTIFTFLNIERQDLEDGYIRTYQLMHPYDKEHHSLNVMPHKLTEEILEVRHIVKGQKDETCLISIVHRKELKFSKEQQAEILDIYDKNGQKIDNGFFLNVAKIKNVGKTKINRLKEALHFNNDSVDPILPLTYSRKSKILTSSDWDKIRQFCGTDIRHLKQIRRDFDYFLGSKSSSNRTVDQYIKYLQDRKNKNVPSLVWLAPYYSDVDINSIYRVLTDETN